MRFRPKRFIKTLFYLTACSVMAISLFHQLMNISERVNTNLEYLTKNNDKKTYYAGGDMFYYWNFTSNIRRTHEFLRKYHKLNNPWTFSIAEYISEQEVLCGGAFVHFAKSFTVLQKVLVDPSKGVGRIGGEDINDVANQSQEEELYTLSKGFFNLKCDKMPDKQVFFAGNDHQKSWMTAINFTSSSVDTKMEYIQKPIIVVQRYEYTNLYHVMTDWYNIFLAYLMFGLGPNSSNILWLDGHPKGGLDKTWKTSFGSVVRVDEIKEPMSFKTMIWNMVGFNSPIVQHELAEVPYLEEFRHFVLTRHDVTSFQMINCSAVTVTFIWRRDYIAHPRNPNGKVLRKIKNEKELITSLRSTFPMHKVRGYQLDSLPMEQQLQIIAETDILIGMHGAGLTHTLFLPPHAALVELFPGYGKRPIFFESMARWRGLKYVRWVANPNRQYRDFTEVSPMVMKAIVKELTKNMC